MHHCLYAHDAGIRTRVRAAMTLERLEEELREGRYTLEHLVADLAELERLRNAMAQLTGKPYVRPGGGVLSPDFGSHTSQGPGLENIAGAPKTMPHRIPKKTCPSCGEDLKITIADARGLHDVESLMALSKRLARVLNDMVDIQPSLSGPLKVALMEMTPHLLDEELDMAAQASQDAHAALSAAKEMLGDFDE